MDDFRNMCQVGFYGINCSNICECLVDYQYCHQIDGCKCIYDVEEEEKCLETHVSTLLVQDKTIVGSGIDGHYTIIIFLLVILVIVLFAFIFVRKRRARLKKIDIRGVHNTPDLIPEGDYEEPIEFNSYESIKYNEGANAAYDKLNHEQPSRFVETYAQVEQNGTVRI